MLEVEEVLVEAAAGDLSEEEEAVTEAVAVDLEVAEEAVDLIVSIQVEVEEEEEEGDTRLFKINTLMCIGIKYFTMCTININDKEEIFYITYSIDLVKFSLMTSMWDTVICIHTHTYVHTHT